MSILHDFIESGKKQELLEFLRDAPQEDVARIINAPSENRRGETALHLAALRGWTESIHALAQAGADLSLPDAEGRPPLLVAVSGNALASAKALLEAGAGVDARLQGTGPTALHRAIELRLPEMAGLLLDYGASLSLRTPADDEKGMNAFHHAAHAGPAMTELLLQRPGAEAAHAFAYVDKRNVSALRIALENGDRKLAERLLDWGARVNETDDNGETALFHLLGSHKSREEAMPLVRMLLRRGADVDKAKNYWDETALFPALRSSFTEAVELLLGLGLDPNHQSYLQDTPLHVVAETWDGAAAKLLLKAGARTEVPNRNGRTPLHVAAHSNKLAVVKALLEAGADPFATDRNGKKPSDLAPAPFQESVRRLLLQKEQEIEIRKYGHAMYNQRRRAAEEKQKPRYKNHSSHPFQNRR